MPHTVTRDGRGRIGDGPWVDHAAVQSPPETTNDTASATAGGSAINIDVLANDTDPEGGTLSIDGTPTNSGDGTVSVLVSDGSATDSGTSETIPNGREYIFYTPGPSGETDVVTYAALSSESGLTANGTATVAVSSGGAQEVTITANRVEGTAPAGFIFEAEATGFVDDDLPRRRLHYLWDFDDPNSPDFTAPGPRFDATVNGRGLDWRNSNKAYTWNAGHTFFPLPAEFDGEDWLDFTVKCTVRDRSGNVQQGSTTVRVHNPDTTFSGKIVGVSNVDDGSEISGLYPGADVYSNADDAWLSVSGDICLLFRRGEEHTVTNRRIRNKDKVQIGAYGSSGDKPILKNGATDTNIFLVSPDSVSELCFWGFLLQGDWDVTTETSPTGGEVGASSGIFWESKTNVDTKTTIHDVWTDKVGVPFNDSNKPWKNANCRPNYVFSNVRITDYRGYAIFGNGGVNTAFLGVAILDDPLKRQGLNEKGKRYNDHGPFRLTTLMGNFVFDAVDVSSWAGWSGKSAFDYPNQPAVQAGWRLNPGTSTDSPSEGDHFRGPANFSLSRIAGEGSGQLVLFAKRGSHSSFTITGVVDKCILIPTGPSGQGVLSAADKGYEISNILIIHPRTVFPGGSTADTVISGNGNTPDELSIRGVTYVNWNDPVLSEHQGGLQPFQLFESGSFGKYAYLEHIPWNSGTPSDLGADVTWSEKLFDALYYGLNFKDWDNKMGLGAGTVVDDDTYANQNSFTFEETEYTCVVMPIPVSGELTTTTADAPIDDIFGEIRPATPHRGCVEPSSVPEE